MFILRSESEFMEEVVIRLATVLDVPRLNDLLTQLILFERRYDSNIKEQIVVTSQYQTLLAKEETILLVAEVAGEVVGYLYGYEKNLASICYQKEAYVDAFFVKEAYRRKVLGHKLFASFEQWCQERQIAFVDIMVLIENRATKDFYQRQGYHLFKEYLRKKLS